MYRQGKDINMNSTLPETSSIVFQQHQKLHISFIMVIQLNSTEVSAVNHLY